MSSINSLPNELLEIIFYNIPISCYTDVNQLQSVCKKWRLVLQNSDLRKSIVCSCLGPLVGYSMRCKASIHFCICLKGTHAAYGCRAKIHHCICKYYAGSMMNVWVCKADGRSSDIPPDRKMWLSKSQPV